MPDDALHDETRILHGEAASVEGFGSVSVPVYRAATVTFPTAEDFARRYDHFYDGYTYGLYGTPTSRTLEEKLTRLAGAAGTVLTPSGQSALTLVLMAFVGPGDRVLIADTCYGPVRAFCDGHLARIGAEIVYFDPLVGAGIAGLLERQTRLVLVESPGSNTMEFMDVPAIVDACAAFGTLVVADNTWASPLLFKPLDHGVDISVEALSKHVGGHGDLLMGAIQSADERHHRQLKDMTRLVGLGVSADECSLALRGLQTLGVRLARSAAGALDIATYLRGCAEIEAVLHPAFPECPGHDVWKRDFSGANGVFSVVLAPHARPFANVFVDALRLFKIGASWGGTHSLVAPQNPAGSRTAVPWRRGPVVRFSVGMEHPSDLVADVGRAIGAVSAAMAAASPSPRLLAPPETRPCLGT